MKLQRESHERKPLMHPSTRPSMPGRQLRQGYSDRRVRRVQCAASYVYAAMALLIAYLAYIGVGMWCTNMPPARRWSEDVLCFEVVRHAHYTEVIYTMGKPMREYRLLLRFGGDEPGVHLYSNDAQWSSTIECGHELENRWCSDTVMMSNRERRVRVIDRFRLSKRADVPAIAYGLGLDGVFVLNYNGGYHLGSHHLCPSSSLTCETMPSEYDTVAVTWVEGYPQTTSEVMTEGLWYSTAVARDQCPGAVDLFPFELMAPEQLLSVSINRMLKDTDFRHMYEAYELGECINKAMLDSTMYRIIRDACRLNPYCRSTVSVSYTHVATAELMILRRNETGCIGARPDASLEEITYVASYGHVMSLAWLRLFLMIFAAAIVYVRSSDLNVKVDTIFIRCIRTIDEGKVTHVQAITMERAVLALIAAITRFALPLIRWRVLAADGLHRALTTELVAGGASIAHWALLHVDCSARRFKVLVFESVPLFLGGSSAVIDVSCATMVAFTNAPLRGGTSTFDAVVRMLTTVLIALVCISRCLFSISCAGLVIGVHKRWPIGDLILMIVAGVFWMVQTISIAVCICDLYATPTAWSFARTTPIDVPVVTMTIFSIFSVLSGPTISMTAMRISERAVRHPKSTQSTWEPSQQLVVNEL